MKESILKKMESEQNKLKDLVENYNNLIDTRNQVNQQLEQISVAISQSEASIQTLQEVLQMALNEEAKQAPHAEVVTDEVEDQK